MAKVCVIGGAGGIGQPTCLLLKMNRNVGHLAVFDLVGAPGVAADLSHIDSPAKVTGHGMSLAQFTGPKKIANQDEYQTAAISEALTGCDIVIIPAGVPRKPGMTRQDLFNVNAGLVKGFADAIAKHCPRAMVAVVTNPVNSTVPIMAEQLKTHGVYDKDRLFGVTSLDLVRARTFVAAAAGADVTTINVPVVGGHAGKSILPLLSQAAPAVASSLSAVQVEQLTERIQNGGTEVVEAKAGAGSATLSMAKAGAFFVDSLLRAKNGERGIVEYALVELDKSSDLFERTKCDFFACAIELGPAGLQANLGIGSLSEFEKARLKEAVAELRPSIEEGANFIRSKM